MSSVLVQRPGSRGGCKAPMRVVSQVCGQHITVPCVLGLLILVPTEFYFCLMEMGESFHALHAPLGLGRLTEAKENRTKSPGL